MEPQFKTIAEKKIIGIRQKMSFADDTTPALWKTFMARRFEIKNALGEDLYSIQTYPDTFTFTPPDVDLVFEKFAGREVANFENVPARMDTMIIPSGLYAVFNHRGTPMEFRRTFGFIFQKWLPKSEYNLSPRPHFEILGSKYKNNDPNSEEEVWIPIQRFD